MMNRKGGNLATTKRDNNYRQAAAGEPRCSQCRFLLYRELKGMNGELRGKWDYRCTIIGDHESQRYHINPHVNRCDRWAEATHPCPSQEGKEEDPAQEGNGAEAATTTC
jgi:hypothetical protein